MKYHKHTRVIHSISALMIIGLFILGKLMEKQGPDTVMSVLPIHSVGGYLLLILTIYRTWLLFKKERPAPVDTGKKWNQKLMYFVHRAFYVLIFIAICSGIGTAATGGYPEAFETMDASLIHKTPVKPVHGMSTFAMILLVVAHVGGVIRHYVRTKENTLKRIL